MRGTEYNKISRGSVKLTLQGSILYVSWLHKIFVENLSLLRYIHIAGISLFQVLLSKLQYDIIYIILKITVVFNTFKLKKFGCVYAYKFEAINMMFNTQFMAFYCSFGRLSFGEIKVLDSIFAKILL